MAKGTQVKERQGPLGDFLGGLNTARQPPSKARPSTEKSSNGIRQGVRAPSHLVFAQP